VRKREAGGEGRGVGIIQRRKEEGGRRKEEGVGGRRVSWEQGGTHISE